MDGCLLVAHEDVVQIILMVVECIVDRHDGTARITEQHVHTFAHKGAHQRFCSRYSFFHFYLFLSLGAPGRLWRDGMCRWMNEWF